MKILFDCTYLRNTHTGVDIYFLSLIPNILELGSDNTYTILVDSRYNQKYLISRISQYSNYTIKKIYSPLPLQVLYSAFFIPFYLRIKGFDVYHNPYFFGPLLPFVCSGTKVVITVHDMYHRSIPELMNRFLNVVFKFFGDHAIRFADEVIVISEQTKADVKTYLNINEGRLNLVHQALNDKFNEHSYPDINTLGKFGLVKDKYILTVGKVLPSKGLDDLLKGFSLFTALDNNDMKIVSAGTHPGEFINDINKLVEQLGLKNSVKLLGYVEDGELFHLYKNCAVVVVPSHYEGFGLPILEAMKFGKPVIVRNASSLTEVVADGGLLFNTNEELSTSLIKIVSDENLKRDLVTKGYERLKDFSWQSTARKTINIYNK